MSATKSSSVSLEPSEAAKPKEDMDLGETGDQNAGSSPDLPFSPYYSPLAPHVGSAAPPREARSPFKPDAMLDAGQSGDA